MSKETIEALHFLQFICLGYSGVITFASLLVILTDIDMYGWRSTKNSIVKTFKKRNKIIYATFVAPIVLTFISLIIHLQLNNEQFIDNLLFNLAH